MTTNTEITPKFEFQDGQQISQIVGRMPNEANDQWVMRLGDHPKQCRSMTVAMQCGHMSMVPFAKCVTNEGEVTLIDLLAVESITLLEKEQ